MNNKMTKKVVNERTLLDWVKEKSPELKKIFEDHIGKKMLWDYKIVSPVSLDDSPEINVMIRKTKDHVWEIYKVPFV